MWFYFLPHKFRYWTMVLLYDTQIFFHFKRDMLPSPLSNQKFACDSMSIQVRGKAQCCILFKLGTGFFFHFFPFLPLPEEPKRDAYFQQMFDFSVRWKQSFQVIFHKLLTGPFYLQYKSQQSFLVCMFLTEMCCLIMFDCKVVNFVL